MKPELVVMQQCQQRRCSLVLATTFVALALAASVLPCAATAAGNNVRVMYAGSLAHVMQQAVRPAFEDHSGDHFVGFTAGSSRLANEIRGEVRAGDVFLSAHPDVNKKLMGSANGDWVDWYATFMRSPLVLGYNPDSDFAEALQSQPWYQVITRDDINVGRTDPELDPKGRLTVEAANRIADRQKDPQLKESILDHVEVYPEEALVGRLQSGQIDAGFFYKGEAAAVGVPTVQIKPVEIGAIYTITVLNRAEHASGANDFIRFLLGPGGRQVLKENGFNVLDSIRMDGDTNAVPDALQSLLSAE